jgi:hypothetical protein
LDVGFQAVGGDILLAVDGMKQFLPKKPKLLQFHHEFNNIAL